MVTTAALTLNFADKTVWTRDNLDILRGPNSACVDLTIENLQLLRSHNDRVADE